MLSWLLITFVLECFGYIPTGGLLSLAFFFVVVFSENVTRLKCFFVSLGGHRSLLLAALICLCVLFDGNVTMVGWMS